MTTDPDLVRRATRLENEVESIYELIDAFRAETTLRFDQHDARFDRTDATLAEILRRLPATS